MERNEILIAILKSQVVPALGCTEPGAVAYAVARAKELLDGDTVKKMTIQVDKNTLKNGMDVGIPGTTESGIIFAAALSLVVGKAEYVLQVLKDTTPPSIKEALKIVESSVITLEHYEQAGGLYISVEAQGEKNECKVLIKNSHTNIVFESVNGKVLKDNEAEPAANASKDSANASKGPTKEIKFEIKNYNFDQLIDFVNEVPLQDIQFIQEGIDMNMRIADIGISTDLGVGYGKYLYKEANTLYEKAKAYTAAASEARMSGYPLPVMSSAGSGNHGLVAILPISVIGDGLNLGQEKIIRAITLSHLVTVYVKVYLGALSPVCGCGVAAGVGSAAGLTYLRGGNKEQIKNAISNMVAGIAGMLCDGAKLGCSYKLSISVNAVTEASDMALNNVSIPPLNGILGLSAEQTVQNLAMVSSVGMDRTDNVMLDVMLNHRCS